MKLRVTVFFAAVAAVIASTGCQSRADQDTLTAAPPTAPNAKAPTPTRNKPLPADASAGVSGAGGAAPAPAAGP